MDALYQIPVSGRRRHITFSERLSIETAYNHNLRLPKRKRLSNRALAKAMRIPRSTFADEIKRGLLDRPNIRKEKEYFEYSAQKAQDAITIHYANKGCPMKMTTGIAEIIRRQIVDKKRSPYDVHQKMVSGELGRFAWIPSTSTLYNHVHAGDMGITPQDLHCPRKSRGKPHEGRPRRSLKNPENVSIEERKDISDRREFGHWEMDTIVSGIGGRGGLLVLVERQSRYCLIGKLEAISQDEVLAALNRMIRAERFRRMLSITTDNGSEFLNQDSITGLFRRHGMAPDLYYTHAYAAWEKGSVENTNRLIRHWYPKGFNFQHLRTDKVAELEAFINSIARKSLNGRTANEMYQSVP